MSQGYKIGINIFVISKNRLLLGKRKNAYGAGEWGLPGGHLEMGEKFEAAAARELMEETGLKAEKFVFANIVNQPRDNSGHYIQIGFMAQGVAGEPELREPDRCEAWQWFELGAFPQNLFSAHQRLVDLFLQQGLFAE